MIFTLLKMYLDLLAWNYFTLPVLNNISTIQVSQYQMGHAGVNPNTQVLKSKGLRLVMKQISNFCNRCHEHWLPLRHSCSE